MKDIYFKCSACRKSLVVGHEAAGCRAPCPECGIENIIPARSAMPPDVKRFLFRMSTDLIVVFLLTFLGVRFLGENTLPAIAPATDWVEQIKEREASLAAATQRVAEVEQEYRDKEARLLDEKLRLEKENQKIASQFEGLANWVLTTFGGKFPLADKFVSNLNMPAVTDDYGLNPDVAEVLQITPEEKALVDDALATTFEEMERVELDLLTVKQMTSDRVTLYVPPYSEDGELLREDLYSAMETTLGSSRFDRLVDITESELAASFHYFGTASRTLIFEMMYPVDPDEKPYVVIKDGWIVPDGASSRSVNVKETAVQEIPETYLTYSPWLPEGMVDYFRK